MNKKKFDITTIGVLMLVIIAAVVLIITILDSNQVSSSASQNVETVQVQERSFDTITMDQYDRMVDFVYKYAGDEEFPIQYALSECMLNAIEELGYQKNVDTYLDRLYEKYGDRLPQTSFENESEDTQDAIREAVQSALDERTMPSGVTKFEKYNESTKYFNKYENYVPEYLSDSLLKFYYGHHYVDYD